LPLGEATAALRRRCEDALGKLRVKKAALLKQFPDVLRKSASRPLQYPQHDESAVAAAAAVASHVPYHMRSVFEVR
jgi:hypothetical protein